MTGTLDAISLFSNCGVGDVGYTEAGFKFHVMAELDWRRLEVAKLNHPDAECVAGDLRATWRQVVKAYQAKADGPPALLAACPPCQGLSTARSGRGKHDDADAGSKDPRNLLVTIIVNVARALKPRAIVVENVPAFLTRAVRHPRTGTPVSATLILIQSLKRDYRAYPLYTDLADFGVPQSRKRAFITLIRKDEPGDAWLIQTGRAPYPRPTHVPEYGRSPVTLRQALMAAKLKSLDARSISSANDPEDPMHFVPVWADYRYPMVAAIPSHVGLSAWDNNGCPQCNARVSDLETAVCQDCGVRLLRPSVRQANSWRLIRGFRATSYRRMKSDEPAATITTASGHVGSDYTIHPWENRLLSPRECAELQTIPRTFQWGDALRRWGTTNVREMIGEAVPPLFTSLHGRAIAGVLKNAPKLAHISCTDPRVIRAVEKLRCAEEEAKRRR